MPLKRFSQRAANLFPVPARHALVVLGLFVALAALAGLLLLLGPVSAPVTAAPAVTDPSLDLSGPLQFMTPLTSTTTSLSSSKNPATYGDTVQFTARVERDDTQGSVPGSVRFFVDINDNGSWDGYGVDRHLGSYTLSGYWATTGDVELDAGAYAIRARYTGSGDFDPSTSSRLTQTVDKISVEITLDCDDSKTYGQTVVCTATADPTSATGMVFFDDKGAEVGRAMLDGGSAELRTFRLGAGLHRIKAIYQGDQNHEGDESNVEEVIVAKADTEIDPFVSSDDDSVYGQYVTFTATVTHTHAGETNWPGVTTPTGLVTFWSDDGTYQLPMGQGTLNGEGQAWFGTSGLAVGDYTITASYEGDANYNPSDEDLDQDVNKADTEVEVTGPDSSYYGESVTFEAKVSAVAPGAGSPTGKVVFSNWGDDFEATLYEGKAIFMPLEPHDVGSVTITAEYKGDDNFKGDSGTKDHTVTKADTTTELQDPLPETDYGQDAQFTVSVKRREDEPGLGTPTGTVTLTITPGLPSSIAEKLPDTGSVVTIVTNTLRPGDHNITAEYGGDKNFEKSDTTADPITHTVNEADSETSLESSVNPSAFGQSVTFTATVEAAGLGVNASTSPTGTVTFKDGGAAIPACPAPVPLASAATCTTSDLSAGTHEITAEYSGDSSFKPSQDSLRQTVNTIATTTSLSSSHSPGNTSVINESVTFTATVSETVSGDPVADGDVTFYDGVTVLDTKTLVAGVATYDTSSLSAGLHPIKAVYNGTANFQPSTSQRLYHTVGAVGSTTALTSSPASPTVFGQTVTFTATVTGSGGTPTGQVTFKDGAATIGSKTLVSGVATLTKSDLSVGTHPIKAVYGGDADFAGSTSNQIDHQVDKADTSVDVSSSDNPSVFGQTVVFTATVTAVAPGAGTPTGTVQFKADGSAIGSPIPLSGGSASVSTSSLSVGTHEIKAEYTNNDGNFEDNTGTLSPDQQVDKADTTTTVTSSPDPSIRDQEVTITANVTADSPSTATPDGGNVDFDFGDSSSAVSVPLVNGTASTTHTFTSDGSFTITATYLGDGTNFNPSPPGTKTHDVNPRPAKLSVTKTDSPDPVNVGNDLTYVINVTNNEAEDVDVTLTDTLPPQATFVSATPSQGICPTKPNVGDPGGTVTCDLGSLTASGGSASVTIIVNVPTTTPAGTVLVNTAQAGAHSDTEETTVYRSFSSGDCNGDYTVNVADVWSIVRHIFDPTFQGTSGCDANQDRRVDAGDVPSTVLIMLNGPDAGGNGGDLNSVTGPVLSSVEGPALTMPAQVSAVPGGLATVPVSFDANGHSITSLIFSVDYDETWLALDPTDRDGNGIPDAVIFSLPGDFTASVTFDEGDSDGEVDVFIGDISPPLTSLSDGPVVYMILDVDSPPDSTQGAVRFSLDPAASFGDTSGQSVPGTATPTGMYPYQIYLPVLKH